MALRKYINRLFPGPKVLVLMYHRIADLSIDPWDLAVHPNNFEQHLVALRNRVIPINALLRQLQNGRIEKDAVCLTFDDGYTDNYIAAAPLLEKYQRPATFFIPPGYMDRREMFWWDALTEIFLQRLQLPHRLDIAISNKTLQYDLENNGTISFQQVELHEQWRWPAAAPTQRCEIYLALWELIRDLPGSEIDRIMKYLIGWSGLTGANAEQGRPMSEEQLSRLSSGNLFTLGDHTMSHPALGMHNRDVQQEELVSCRDYLRQRFSNYTNAVAYPYGHYNTDTLSVMQSCAFDGGFTTNEKPVTVRSDVYQLGRFKVCNIGGKEFSNQISAWFRQ